MKERQSRRHKRVGYLLTFLALASLLGWGSSATATADDKPFDYPVLLPLVTGMPNWIRVGNIPENVTIFYDIAVCSSYHLAGTNNGLYTFKTGGTSWLPQTLGNGSPGIVSGVAFANSECNVAYVVSQSVGLWRGSRTGDNWSWTPISQGLSKPVVVLVRDNTLFLAGDFGIRWASPLPTNNSAIWQQAADITTTTYSLSLGLKTPRVTYAAVWNEGVFEQSPTEATEWHEIGAATIPNRLVYDVAANTSPTATLVAGTDKGLMRRQGGTWATTAGQFTNTNLTVLAVGQRFYAGQKGNGVLYSVDEGANWQQMNSTLPVNPDFSVRRLRLSWNKERLYVATNAGVWQWLGKP